MVGPVGQADGRDCFPGAGFARLRPHAGVGERQLDVVEDRRLGQEVVALEDEADLAVTQGRQLVVAERRRVFTLEVVSSAAGPVEEAHDVHQR